MFTAFNEEQKRRANEADLVSLLERNGQQVKKSGSEYIWKDEGRIVSIKDNLWFSHYEQIGGNTVGFVMKYFGLSYPEALGFILDEDTGVITHTDKLETKPAPFTLPKKNLPAGLYLVNGKKTLVK